MSTILDALRKAHQAQAAPEPAVLEPKAPEPETPKPAAPEPVLEREAPPAERYHFDEEPTPLASPLPPEPPAWRLEAPSPPAPPPTGDETGSPPEEPPSYLPPDDDSGARRRLVTRALAVVAIGVLLGLLVGRRFTSSPEGAGDDLLSTAALEPATAKKPETKQSAKDPPPVEGSDLAEPAKAKKKDASTSKRARHGGAAAEGATRPATKNKNSEDAEIEGPPAPAAAPSRPAPPTPPAVVVKPPPALEPTPTPLPFGAPPPAVMPPGSVAAATPPSPAVSAPPPPSPPPPPAELPPPPDDAPALSLLFIQWSADASKRVASLRQSGGGTIYIVREGDMVAGLRIGVIRPAGVEVQWRGQSFLVPASRF